MGTSVYSTNFVRLWRGEAVKLGFPEDINYVFPGMVLGEDTSYAEDTTISFVEGNDCQYLDIYNPNIQDIGMEHNVYHEKHGSLVRFRYNNSLYLPSYSGTLHEDENPKEYTTWSWTMSPERCFLWYHRRQDHYLYGWVNDWDIEIIEPVFKNGILYYGLVTYMDQNFRYGQYDGITDPNYFIQSHPEYFTKYNNTYPWDATGSADVIVPEILSYPDRNNHVLTGGIESACALEALNSLKANSNNIQNVFAIVELAKSLLHPSKLPSLLKALPKKGAKRLTADAWLKYRYVYKTTMSDVEEMTRFIIQGLDHSNTITLRGGMTTPAGTCRVRINAKTKNLSQFAFLQKYGVAPDLYNFWDMVPFSFIVDWFVGIGDFAQQISDQQWAINFDVVSCTTSWKWVDSIQTTLGPVPFTHYQRFVTSTAPPFVPYSSDTVSEKTLIKRLLDGASLLLGK